MKFKSRRKPQTVMFHGFKIVNLQGDFCREAIRVARDGSMLAVIQKNGNIGMSGTGIFDKPDHPRSKACVARMLGALKMVAPEFVQGYLVKLEQYQRELDVVTLKNDAQRLDFRVVPVEDY